MGVKLCVWLFYYFDFDAKIFLKFFPNQQSWPFLWNKSLFEPNNFEDKNFEGY